MIVGISLHGAVIDDIVCLDVGLVGLLVGVEAFDGRAIKVDLIVHNQERIVCIHHIVVHTHTIQVLLQQRLKEHVLFLQCGLLLLDGELVEQDLIETLVELIEQLELVVLLLLETLDPLNRNLGEAFLGTTSGVGVTLVEGKHLLLLGLQFAAELGCLQDLLAQSLILSQFVHAHLRVQGEVSESAFLVLAELNHLLLEVVIVFDDHLLFLAEFLVSLLALALILLDLQRPVGDLLLQPVYRTLEGVNLL